jgi:rare lipoprotein A
MSKGEQQEGGAPAEAPGTLAAPKRRGSRYYVPGILIVLSLGLSGCTAFSKTRDIAEGTVDVGVAAAKGTYKIAAGTTKAIYKVGEFTFEVVTAPLDWPLWHDEIDTIDGLPVKEAIRLGRVKCSPYTVNGNSYHPMSVEEAQDYREVGLASWYGYETRRKPGGYMTANGEAFDPEELTAAHKYLPLPTDVRVTNLENGRSVIVRVNDRGPFPCAENPRSGERVIDVSLGAAKQLGFYGRGIAKVQVETVQVD